MKAGSDTHRHMIAVVRRLEEALRLLDKMDRGDSDSAAYIERAVQRAKRELRSGSIAAPLPWLSPRHSLRARSSVGPRDRPRRMQQTDGAQES